MNSIDVIILIIVGTSAIGGLRRGFLLGVADLVVLGLALFAAARLSGLAAEPLREAGLTDPIATTTGFFIAAVLAYAVVGLAVRLLLAPVAALNASTPLGWVNGVLGLLPGAVRGLAFAALLVITMTMVPAGMGLRHWITGSQLAEPLAIAGQEALQASLEWADIDPASIGLSSRTLRSIRQGLPFAGAGDVQIDDEAERILFELANQERAAIGLPPLERDGELTAVGRLHSREMFDLGFFSHVSPVSGGPRDRLAAAGLTYRVSAENIALAPTAHLAHQGLMNSPAYRANILNPDFTHMGVSALRSVDHGLMVTQEFGG